MNAFSPLVVIICTTSKIPIFFLSLYFPLTEKRKKRLIILFFGEEILFFVYHIGLNKKNEKLSKQSKDPV